MEDHMITSDGKDTGSTCVTMVKDAIGTGPDLDLQLLSDRVKILEQSAGSAVHSDNYLENRVRQLERSERSLLLQLYQLAAASHLPSMQHSQRLDQRLHMLKEEVRTMSQEKEQLEHIWRERLQRCQKQLKAKEEEMSRQSQYFQNFKNQLQHKLNQSQDREQSLQNRIYTLEKQLLDMTVSAATGIATITAVRITAGAAPHWEELDRLPSLRGQGEGEEEKKEERRKQWLPSARGQEHDAGKTQIETEGGEDKSSNEARLQGFILSLQEDLRVLLEREESGMTERRSLMDQLQEAQEHSNFLGSKVEEMKAEIHRLKLSEGSLEEEIEELREENSRLQQSLRDAAKHTFSQSCTILESTCLSSGASSPSCSLVACPLSSNLQHNASSGCSEKVQVMDEQKVKPDVSAVVPCDHLAAAESTENTTVDQFSSAKSDNLSKTDRLNFFGNFGSKMNPSIQSLRVTSEAVDEFRLGAWCYRGVLKLEDSPSEESDALRVAYRSLGLEEDLDAIKEQRDRLEDALQHTQEQLQETKQENGGMCLQIHKQHEDEEKAEEEESGVERQITTPSTCEGDNHLLSSSTQASAIIALAADDLVQALNQENRALAERIQELQSHIELREKEITREQTQLKEHIGRLEADGARLEQENQEQGCLITELTRKTEDDLNSIMELQQKLVESERHKIRSQNKEQHRSHWKQNEHKTVVFKKQNNLSECVDSLVNSMEQGDEEAQMQPSGDTTQAPQSGFRDGKNHCRPLQTSSQEDLHMSSLADERGHLSRSIQNLKTEQEELRSCIKCLRMEQQEVTLSVQAQTEEKQQLTRAIWGLKEEKDGISRSLSGLKQDREQLSRVVCGLRDEKDNFKRSMSGLREEKEQLFTSISDLKREKDLLSESLSCGIEERDQTVQSLQNLQNDIDQLSHAVLDLKQERDELVQVLKCLNEQKEGKQSTDTLLEDRAKLIKSVSSLREEQERIELSISHLKEEEKEIMLSLEGLKEENGCLQTALPSQPQTDERWKPHLLNVNRPEPRCQSNVIQEQNDFMEEIEALGTALQKSQEELEKTYRETQRLHRELGQSEAKREEAERKVSQLADKVSRLTDAANQVEETRKENESLMTQVKELQNKLKEVVKEKTDALSLKAQIEEHYHILAAQLKAKTVALEELNSEYISLKQGHSIKDDLSTVLMSLRARYDDIRAKYDTLLQKKSQTDLDMAPLKAKLSCLVLKCQERNNQLAQMTKVMHKHGCMDYALKQRVDQLLSDTGLQSYSASFTPGSIKTHSYNSELTAGVFSKAQDCNNRFIPVIQSNQSKLTTECKMLRSEECSSVVKAESTTIRQDGTNEKISASEENANISLVPTSPVQEAASAQVSRLPSDSISTNLNQLQLSSSTSGRVQKTSAFHQSNTKADPSPDGTGLSEPSGSSSRPVPASSDTSISLSKRLSSPEKIISLHEQLQKTLQSSYQAPVSSGKGQQTRESPSLSSPVDLNLASQTRRQNPSTSDPRTPNLPVTADSSQMKHTPGGTSRPVPTHKPTTMFSAVVSRSANVKFRPNNFNHPLKADVTPTTSSLSSSSNSVITNVPSKEKFTSSSGANIPVSPKLTNKTSTMIDGSDVTQTPLPALPQNNTTFMSKAVSPTKSDVLIHSDTPPKTTALEVTAPCVSTATKTNIFSMISKIDGAAHTHDGLVSAHRSTRSANKSPDASDKAKSPRAKQEAPAEVHSVEVIQTVGQSSLMIGWERPPLDELGRSNGTFVYGYRVFVDGDFHKSVMSSACTKCILENVDMSVPLRISVQTLGSNGLSSNSVHTTYRTSPADGN